ncbi:MAG: hypothetical protein GC192_09595 [Bacteroidetes bacterium]|nr:hypothetical protein [Bacteroidota bacterium]
MEINVEIVNQRLLPNEKQIEPSIEVMLLLTHPKNGIAVQSVRAELYLGDNMLCWMNSNIPAIPHHDAFLNTKINQSGVVSSFNVSLTGVLSNKVLNYLEVERNKNIKGDLNFVLKIEVQYLNANFDSITLPNVSSGKLISIHDRGALFEIKYQEVKLGVTIHNSTWIHDFLPVFGLGTYLVFDIPNPVIVHSKDKLAERLEAAFEAVEKMEEARVKGEWYDVIRHSRQIWELVRDENKITELLENSAFTEDAIKEFNEMVKHSFEYASKFIHRIPRKNPDNVMPIMNVEKEDALFVYSICVNALNVLATKINRQNQE